MPNSEFTEAQRQADDAIRLVGPIHDVPDDTRVRLQVTVTQPNGFVAKAEQIVGATRTAGGVTPTRFAVIALPTSWTRLDPEAPLKAVGFLVSEAGGAEAVFQWVDDLIRDSQQALTASDSRWVRLST